MSSDSSKIAIRRERLALTKVIPELANGNPSPLVLARAEAERRNAGLSDKAFKTRNVAVFKLQVAGDVQCISAANDPMGMHSEEFLLGEVEDLKRQHGRDKVQILEVFSERRPCRSKSGVNSANCRDQLRRAGVPATQIFYAISTSTSRTLDVTKLRLLLEAYGIGFTA